MDLSSVCFMDNAPTKPKKDLENMKIEQTILYALYACTFISLAFRPKDKLKHASIIFLYQQFVTWFLGLLVVELYLIEYPVRELANINETSFLFEFLAFPIISIFFCLYYPQKSNAWRKFLYTSAFCTEITIAEVIKIYSSHNLHKVGVVFHLVFSLRYLNIILAFL